MAGVNLKIDFEQKRRDYIPSPIECLFIAEAPPREETGRFFYLEAVPNGDSLFLEMVKVLYPEAFTCVGEVRRRKRDFLLRLQADSYYLIDSTDEPIRDASRRARRDQIREALPSLLEKMEGLVSHEIPVILISKPVYDVCFLPLRFAGFNVMNNGFIDFPGSGGQKKFRRKLSDLLCGIRQRWHQMNPHIICPMPDKWNEIHQALRKAWEESDLGGNPPPIPLILGGWWFSSDLDKRHRWEETIQWAESRGFGHVIPELEHDEWYTSFG